MSVKNDGFLKVSNPGFVSRFQKGGDKVWTQRIMKLLDKMTDFWNNKIYKFILVSLSL